jgi:hypothetical protein
MPGPYSGISVYKSFFNYFHVLNIHVLIELFIYFVVLLFFTFEISISYHPCFCFSLPVFFDGLATFYGRTHHVRCALPVDG